MQTVDDRSPEEAPSPPRVTAFPSLAIDLSWALHGARSDTLRFRHPEVAALDDAGPGLAERVRGFWDALTCFSELEVLAWHAHALAVTEAAELWPALERACRLPVPDLPLETETPEDRQVILDRLARLRTDRRTRTRYFDLLRDVHSALGAHWPSARASSATAAAALQAQLERGMPWRDLVSVRCERGREVLAAIGPHHTGTIAIVPSSLFGMSMILSLPGTLLIGAPAVSDGAAARARTEALAHRLKTVADPTRLAILSFLSAGSATVGDVARAFGLAQPTVSTHLKQLREAGLVHASRRGTRIELGVDRAALGSLFDELHAVAP